MTALPYMPILWQRLIADTTHLSNEEFGAYMRILVALWAQDGSLDPADLRRITGTPKNRWPRLWARLMNFFELSAENRLIQKRLISELERAKKNHAANQVRAEKARAGIARRRNVMTGNSSPQRPSVDKPVTAPKNKPQATVEATVDKTVTELQSRPSVTVIHPEEEELLPINRQSSSSSENMADHAAVENPQGQGGRNVKRADDEPVGGGDRADQEALPKPLGAVVGQPGSGSLFARLEAERRRREGEGEASVSEPGEG